MGKYLGYILFTIAFMVLLVSFINAELEDGLLFESSLEKTVSPIFERIKLVIGGIFGIYFLLLIARVYYERKKVKILQDICYNLERANQFHGIRFSQHKGIYKRVLEYLKDFSHSRKISHAIIKSCRSKK